MNEKIFTFGNIEIEKLSSTILNRAFRTYVS